MTTRIDDCKCGHGRSTHHDGKYACLASFCDCDSFRAPSSPDERPPRPDHASHCRCFICKQWAPTERA